MRSTISMILCHIWPKHIKGTKLSSKIALIKKDKISIRGRLGLKGKEKSSNWKVKKPNKK
jgi:hypothetical protein